MAKDKAKEIKAWALFNSYGKILCNGSMPLIFNNKPLAEHHMSLMPNVHATTKIVRVIIKEVK